MSLPYTISGDIEFADTTSNAGDILFANASNVLTALPPAADGTVLTLSGGLPSWQTPVTITSENFSATADGTFTFSGTTASLISSGWTENYDTGIFDDTTGQVTVATTGRFHLDALLEFSSDATAAGANGGTVTLELVLDPTGTPSVLRQVTVQPPSNANFPGTMTLASDLELTAADVVALRISRTSDLTGGSTNDTTVTANTYFNMHYFSESI